MKLSVIIVNYNVKYYAEQCLRSLQDALAGIDAEVIVVDNHSIDGSVEYLSGLFPDVTFISSNHNLGFAKANNIALRQCGGEFILLLNPDTIVPADTISDSILFMEQHPAAGGIGVRMMKADGSDALESRRGFPTPMTAFFKMCGLCAQFPTSRRFGKYYMGYLPWDEPAEIDVISGAYCFLRRQALDQVGLLDEDFFMYGEDIDLSYRLQKGGWQNWYVPSRILHYKGESTQKSSFRYVHVFYRAMFIFLRKHDAGMSLLLSVPIRLAIFLKAMSALVTMQIDRIRSGLGFSVDRRNDPLYVMIGNEVSVRKCQELAFDKGIQAQYIIGDARTLPQGHLGKITEKDRRVYAVYDTESYSFSQILSLFARNDQPNVRLGIYNSSQHIIITEEEILR